ncbi:MAG: methyltransferase [Flavobacteriales bacterium]|nr:methyltransferase [Flavobacteriales bacterium]
MPELFKFKQFELYHGSGGIKVNTDAIICGAWANFSNDTFILDIGTGCGIIALMAAQRSNAIIHAIEAEANSISEANVNFRNSKWRERFQLFHLELQQFKPDVKYAHIISNPPYFMQSLPATEIKKKIARHAVKINYNDIFIFAKHHLVHRGKITLIFPFEYKTKIFSTALSQGFYPQKIANINALPHKKPFRIICEFSNLYTIPNLSFLTIMKDIKTYTEEYTELSKDFYTFM